MTLVKSSEDELVSLASEYSVRRIFADGKIELVCHDVSAVAAAQEFWRCTKNVSAMSGVVQAVAIVNGRDHVDLAWEHGRGYTYDGENFHENPVVNKELH